MAAEELRNQLKDAYVIIATVVLFTLLFAGRNTDQ